MWLIDHRPYAKPPKDEHTPEELSRMAVRSALASIVVFGKNSAWRQMHLENPDMYPLMNLPKKKRPKWDPKISKPKIVPEDSSEELDEINDFDAWLSIMELRNNFRSIVKKMECQLSAPRKFNELEVSECECHCDPANISCKDLWSDLSKCPLLFSCTFTRDLNRLFLLEKGVSPLFRVGVQKIEQLKPLRIRDIPTYMELEFLERAYNKICNMLGRLPKDRTTVIRQCIRAMHTKLKRKVSHFKTNWIRSHLRFYLQEL
jgi:hypothetical protein